METNGNVPLQNKVRKKITPSATVSDETVPLNAYARVGTAEQRVNKMFIVQS